jgi:hypothetical protein
VAFLLFVDTNFSSSTTTNVLPKHIKALGVPPKQLSNCVQPIKDDLALKTAGVYRILRKCGKVYIGQTGHLIETGVTEHH